MPSTLPGFLLLAGILMFLLSLFRGSVKIKDTALPALSKRNRWIVRMLGLAFMLASFMLYGFGVIQPMMIVFPK
jgi:hypothetical protein